jgi:hypothetical protein
MLAAKMTPAETVLWIEHKGPAVLFSRRRMELVVSALREVSVFTSDLREFETSGAIAQQLLAGHQSLWRGRRSFSAFANGLCLALLTIQGIAARRKHDT